MYIMCLHAQRRSENAQKFKGDTTEFPTTSKDSSVCELWAWMFINIW